MFRLKLAVMMLAVNTTQMLFGTGGQPPTCC